MAVKSFHDLEVWQVAMQLVVGCYKATREFPKSELYGLTSQLQRAAVSVPANIAEGQARQHTSEFLQFLSIASGSVAELETHLLIAVELEYLTKEVADTLLAQAASVSKMLRALRAALQRA